MPPSGARTARARRPRGRLRERGQLPLRVHHGHQRDRHLRAHDHARAAGHAPQPAVSPDDAGPQLEIEGEVIWVNPYRPGAPDNLHPGMGIRFVELDDDVRDRLLELSAASPISRSMAIICGTDLSAASRGRARGRARARGAARRRRGRARPRRRRRGQRATPRRTQLEAHARMRSRPRAAPARRSAPSSSSAPADQTLVSFAETEGSDLIVIAASSQAAARCLRLGTTAERVIAHDARAGARRPRPGAVAARSRAASAAAPAARHRRLGDLRARHPVDARAARSAARSRSCSARSTTPTTPRAHYGLHARALVDRDPEIETLIARDLLRRFGDDAPHVVPRARGAASGRIGDHVVELANEEKVDAIVVGTGQKTGLGRLGSVSSVIVARRAAVGGLRAAAGRDRRRMRVPTSATHRWSRPTCRRSRTAPCRTRSRYADRRRGPRRPRRRGRRRDRRGRAAQPAARARPAGSAQTLEPHVVRGDDAATRDRAVRGAARRRRDLHRVARPLRHLARARRLGRRQPAPRDPPAGARPPPR